MKKVVHWFNKKKKQMVLDSIDSDAIPEQPRCIPRYIPKRCNLYDDFRLSDSGHEKNSSIANHGNEICSETVNGPAGNSSVTNLPAIHEEFPSQQTANEEPVVSEKLPVTSTASNESTGLSAPHEIKNQTSENLSKISPSANMDSDADSMQALPNGYISKKSESSTKNGGNSYVISIINSTHFHIGTQKTINYGGEANNNVQRKEVEFTNMGKEKLSQLEGNHLLDIKDKLSEEDLLQISLSVRDKWRELAKNLGIEETEINEMEEMNDNDGNLIVHDLLQQYMTRYPNTTVGFIVNVLRKSNEFEAIRKLMEKR